MNETGRTSQRPRPQSLSMPSPAGVLTLRERGGVMVGLDIAAPPKEEAAKSDAGGPGLGRIERKAPSPPLVRARRQLKEYFAGRRRTFDLPLDPPGTTFQRALWRLLCTIPYGETRTYGELAHALGSSPRAVGRATATNPLPIIIPCHRVIGRNGALTGFSSGEGIATKRRLLALEGARCAARSPPSPASRRAAGS